MIKSKVCFILLFFSFFSFTQETDSTTHQEKPKFQGFPVAFYSPETRFAGGLVGIATFRFKNDSIDSRASSVTIGGAYTQNNQILIYLPYILFLKNDQYRLTGEIGYYKYNFFYFGVGNMNEFLAKESYEVTFPRLRLNAYKRISKTTFIGIRYGYDHFKDLKFQEGGELINSDLPGVNGGVNSSIGIGVISDKRDHQFYPRKGYLLESTISFEDDWTGSDYCFTKLTVDYAKYYSLANRSILAGNINIQSAKGEIPFYMMSLLGGGKRLRGQFEGQQRNTKSIQAQMEYRQEFLKNWGFTVFAGTGLVFNQYENIRQEKCNFGYGTGIRYKLNKKEHVNIRLDVGFGGGQILPYFTLSEAF